jgi:predicted O-methyltransferase YrrM
MKYKHQGIWSELLPSLTWSRNWHEKEDNEVLCKYAEKVNNGHILEIGSAEGQSMISMLLSTSDIYGVIVDPFITSNLLTNIKAMGLGKRVIILPATSEEVFLPPMGYELVFIDAVHTYEAVKHDLEKFSKTGAKYIVLHDTSLEELEKAVNEFVLKGEYEVDFIGGNITVLSKINKDLR